MLGASKQWDLFSYYVPFRTFVINRDTLPTYRTSAASKPRAKKNAKKRVIVFGELKSELDLKQFGDIILRAVHEQRERDASGD
jgi:hypothetical protein